MKKGSSSSERVGSKGTGTRGVPVQMPAPLDTEERQRVLETARPETLWVRLVLGWLCEDIATGVAAVTSPVTASKPQEMAHAGGGLAWALDFRERMEREIAAARKGAET